MEELKSCLVCGHDSFTDYLDCKDYFLTNEDFKIVECPKCQFRFVNPRPEESDLGPYYDSEDYVSHSGSKKGFVNRVYDIVKSYTLSRKFLMINKHAKGKSILDIGCAKGDFLTLFKKNNWECLGLEPNEEARNFAKNNYNLDTKPNNEIVNIPDNSFDVITMWHVLEHVSTLNETLVQIKRILKPNGLLVIAVPNCDCFDAKIYGEYWAGYDVPRHLYHFNQQSFSEITKKHAFNLFATLPMRFDSYYVSMLSEKYRSGGGIVKAFLNGWRSNFKAMKNNDFSSLIFLMKNQK